MIVLLPTISTKRHRCREILLSVFALHNDDFLRRQVIEFIDKPVNLRVRGIRLRDFLYFLFEVWINILLKLLKFVWQFRSCTKLLNKFLGGFNCPFRAPITEILIN